MLRRTFILLAALALSSFSIFAQSPDTQKNGSGKDANINRGQTQMSVAELIEGRVVTVEDGDTITVQRPDQSKVTVRLLAVDAPEFKQDNFKKSKKSLSDLVMTKDVTVKVISKDSLDRLIGIVLVGGQDVGLLQLQRGMAWHYLRFSYEQTAEARRQYAESQAKAQAAGVGIWDEKRPIPPWVFRGDPLEAPRSTSAAQYDRSAVPPPPDRKFILGPMGGCYYLADDGHKVYVKDKSRCAAASTTTKP